MTGPFTYPEPLYEVRIDKDVRVPMRDHVTLGTDLYVPKRPGPLPTILIRTQYGRIPYRTSEPWTPEAHQLAGQGYVVVVQDLRGLFDSEGEYALAASDAPDGYDAISWIVDQPWSNGRVGTLGCSSLGITQVLLAQECHPAHACAVAQASGGATGSAGNRYTFWDVRRGGAVEMGWALEWFYEDGAKDGSRRAGRNKEEYDHVFRSLPLVSMIDRLPSPPPTDWADYVSRQPTDPWWDQFGYLREDSEVDVPTLFVNSWYDIGAVDAFTQYRVFRANSRSQQARDNQRVIISPTKHCSSEKMQNPTRVGAREFGDARLDFPSIYLDWFAAWLQDEPERIADMPTIRYFVMGANEWRHAPDWPPPGVQDRTFYLHSDGEARTRLGNGRLSDGPPTVDAATQDTFVYDPGHAFTSMGSGSGGSYVLCGPRDHTELELREDVLCFTSAPFGEGIEITGACQAVMFLSSSARDTDLVVKLLDVNLDGEAFDIVDGILRVRYREGFDRQVFMEAGQVYRVVVDLEVTSIWLPPGHRLRVDVTSSNFTRFDRNLNTGGRNYDETEWVNATNTIHHSPDHPSHIVVSTMPGGGPTGFMDPRGGSSAATG